MKKSNLVFIFYITMLILILIIAFVICENDLTIHANDDHKLIYEVRSGKSLCFEFTSEFGIDYTVIIEDLSLPPIINNDWTFYRGCYEFTYATDISYKIILKNNNDFDIDVNYNIYDISITDIQSYLSFFMISIFVNIIFILIIVPGFIYISIITCKYYNIWSNICTKAKNIKKVNKDEVMVNNIRYTRHIDDSDSI